MNLPVKVLALLASLVSTVQAELADRLYVEAVHILGGNANVVSKWQGEIRFVVIHGGVSSGVVDAAKAVISEVAAIAGLPVRFPEHRLSDTDYLALIRQTRPRGSGTLCVGALEGCFNFVVAVVSPRLGLELAEAIPLREVYRHALRESPELACFFAPHHQGRHRIVQSFVYVHQDLDAAMLRTCLQEEIYQSFGLYNDVTGSTLFSFNNVVAPKRITEYDKALLQALYDPRVEPGYPVNRVVRMFLANLGF